MPASPPAAFAAGRETGSPAVWAEQSCRIATTPGVYPEQAKIEAGYLDRHRPTAERQVQLGGARLAHLLNDVLM